MAKPRTDEEALSELYQVMNEMQIITQLWSHEMRRVLPDGLTMAQYSVLNWFSRVGEEATPGRLANAFQVTKGAMTNTLGHLLDAGLITLSADPASGRSKIVRRTVAGAELRERALQRTYVVLEDFAAAVAPSRVGGLLPTLREVRHYLDEKRDAR